MHHEIRSQLKENLPEGIRPAKLSRRAKKVSSKESTRDTIMA
jgi:hypothetical protein